MVRRSALFKKGAGWEASGGVREATAPAWRRGAPAPAGGDGRRRGAAGCSERELSGAAHTVRDLAPSVRATPSLAPRAPFSTNLQTNIPPTKTCSDYKKVLLQHIKQEIHSRIPRMNSGI